MGAATINVRMPEELKAGGDAVLARKGKSVSDAVRELYEYLERHQDIPSFMKNVEDVEKDEIVRKRRDALQRLTGILPTDLDLIDIKRERLARQL